MNNSLNMVVPQDIGESIDVFDSDVLVDVAYNGVVGLMDLFPESGKRMLGTSLGDGNESLFDAMLPLKSGLYIPATKRAYYKGFFDVNIDKLPEYGGVYIESDQPNKFEYVAIKRINKLPRHAYGVCGKSAVANYKIMEVVIENNKKLKIKNIIRTRDVFFEASYLQIHKNGSIFRTINLNKRGYTGVNDAYHAYRLGSGALSLLADRKYLWLVNTSERILGSKIEAKVQFGIEEEFIKSLLFARELPLTKTGRKKPILHWVKAHKRRIKEKINIDVKKHLRGIEAIKMGDMEFKITQPTKE